jgi:putative ABC transport system ATP-binding protein
MLALGSCDYRPPGSSEAMLLRGFSAEFAPGRVACLTGPSGTGKTTILSLIAGICLPDAGTVRHGATLVSGLDAAARREWRRAAVGFVFQTCRLIDVLTIAEHMQLVARLRGRPEAAAAGLALAAELGLADKLDRRPGALSGGEKQRVALAQALACGPQLVLADEPTAALDRSNAELVAATLTAYARRSGAIVVAVSHDDTVIDAADDVVRLVKA